MADVDGGIEKAIHLAEAALRDPMLRPVERADDPLEKIVEIVRQATGELADRFHLLGLAQLLFEILAIGDVAGRHREAAPLSELRRYRSRYRLHNRAALPPRISVGVFLAKRLAQCTFSSAAVAGPKTSSIVLPITCSRDIL